MKRKSSSQLHCTCGTVTTKLASNKNATCTRCRKEYMFSKALGKWLYTHRIMSVM